MDSRHDIQVGIGLLIFCGIVALGALRIPAVGTGTSFGPSFMPWLMIGGIALLASALILRATFKGSTAEEEALLPRDVLLRIAAFVAVLILYAACFMSIGYLVSTTVVLVTGMYLLGERRWLPLIILPVLITGAIWLAFTKLLGVWLP